MPIAASRPCAGQCGAIGSWPRGRCPSCASTQDLRRGSNTARGYTGQWRAFVRQFTLALVTHGIAPICGAHLPDGPRTEQFSRCHQDGLFTSSGLQLDHEPPLTQAERERARHGDRSAIDDPLRVGFLCGVCHQAKTQQQRLAS